MKLSIDGRFLLQDVTGVQRVAIEFLQALDRLLADGEFPNVDATVWLPRMGNLVTQPQLNAVRVRRAGILSGHLWEQFVLPSLTRGTVLLCLGNVAPVIRLITSRRPTYALVHDLSYKYFPSAYSRAFRVLYALIMPIVLARSTHLFTVSASEKAEILRHYPRLVSAERLTAAPNGGGEGALGAHLPASLGRSSVSRSAPPAPDRQRMALYVGSLTKRKNGEGLMRAAAFLAETADVDFTVVGATGASFEDLGVDVPECSRARITFLGQINDPQRIAELYRQAMVFIFPSFYESSGLPPIEAMSFGCPVVCSDLPSLRERCGDAALYCDPADFTSIVSQTTRLLDDHALWSKLQQRGLAQSASFSWAGQVEIVLDRVLKDSSSAMS